MFREALTTYYAYWFIVGLMIVGLYGILVKQNLIKKIIGLTIFQTSVIMFFVASASKWNATIPVIDTRHTPIDPSAYINPLPHTLMLTAIVVGVATLGLAFALLITIFRRYGTLDEKQLLERMK